MELLEYNAKENGGRKQMAPAFDFKREVGKYIRKWPWFLLSMLLFYIGAKIYLRYQEPQYLSKTTLKLSQSKPTNQALGDLKSFGMGVSDNEELLTEAAMVMAKPILERVAKEENLQVVFFSRGRVINPEIYKGEVALEGRILSSKTESFSQGFIIYPEKNGGFSLRNKDEKILHRGSFGTPFTVEGITAVITRKPQYQFNDAVDVLFRGIPQCIADLESRITVNIPQDKGLLMDITMVGPLPKKSEDILNEIARQYNIEGIRDKNAEAQYSQDFIDSRLQVISDDLARIENQKESFKTSNSITDLESQAALDVANANEYLKLSNQQKIQLDVVNSMLAALNTDGLIPSGVGAPAGIETGISQYNELLLTRNRTLKQATKENPAVIEMNKQLAAMKNLIRQNLIESRENLQVQLGYSKAQISQAKSNISKFPGQEKVFRGIDRQQNLKEQLYLYLLQKREENAITLAVETPKAKVLNPAYTTGIVSPNYKATTLGALAAGFLLPLAFFAGRNLLDTKVRTKEEILARTSGMNVLATVPQSKSETALINQGSDFSIFAEAFRILSSNLKFILKTSAGSDSGVILVTSSVKGEGKTTVAMNLAATLAGKGRTLIIGADIRNPQLQRFVGISPKNGLTDYLVSEDDEASAFIHPSGIAPNLDILYSGQSAPNPSDLLDMEKFDLLVQNLRKQYNFIVIDTAPVMLVSDTINILQNADALLYVVKAGTTEREMLTFAQEFRDANQVKNMHFVLNGADPKNSRYGKQYGYGYYSYGKEETRWWENFWRKKS